MSRPQTARFPILDHQQAVGDQATGWQIDQASKTSGGDASEQISENVREAFEQCLGEELSEVRFQKGNIAAEPTLVST